MNKKVFGTSTATQKRPATDTVNDAGGKAYKMSERHALAQYLVTGCLNDTYYTKAEKQLNTVKDLMKKVSPLFIAKAAVYGRQEGHMKDMPAILCAHLATVDVDLLKRVFHKVINNGKMLRNFVQAIRSGEFGRKSLGRGPRDLVRDYFYMRDADVLFRQSIGNDPSFKDIINLAHPKPANKSMEALYRYFLGYKVVPKKSDMEKNQYGRYTTVLLKDISGLAGEYETYKHSLSEGDDVGKVPDVPFQFLDSLDLNTADWTEIARNAPWQMCRMNLNTFLRHGVFKSKGMVKTIAEKLSDEKAIKKVCAFPYQLMTAYLNIDDTMPEEIRNALQDAMEIALDNVPVFPNKGEGVVLCPDVSGSMSSPLTGHREGSTTKTRCIDIAGLVAAAVLRNNPKARVLPFDGVVRSVKLNPRDSVMTNATKLASFRGGSTNCSAPLALLAQEKADVSLVIYISDNESWVDSRYSRHTATMWEWTKIKARNPNAKMICNDIQPNKTLQAKDVNDVLNIGGFSDEVFTLIDYFARGQLGGHHWTDVIEAVNIDV